MVVKSTKRQSIFPNVRRFISQKWIRTLLVIPSSLRFPLHTKKSYFTSFFIPFSERIGNIWRKQLQIPFLRVHAHAPLLPPSLPNLFTRTRGYPFSPRSMKNSSTWIWFATFWTTEPFERIAPTPAREAFLARRCDSRWRTEWFRCWRRRRYFGGELWRNCCGLSTVRRTGGFWKCVCWLRVLCRIKTSTFGMETERERF